MSAEDVALIIKAVESVQALAHRQFKKRKLGKKAQILLFEDELTELLAVAYVKGVKSTEESKV